MIADCGLRIADCAQPDRVRAVQAFTKVLSVLRGLEATLCVAHGAVCWGPLEFSNGVFAVAGREFLVADVDAITVEPTRVMICTRSAEVRP